jgi:hypothetical protein
MEELPGEKNIASRVDLYCRRGTQCNQLCHSAQDVHQYEDQRLQAIG